MSLSRQRNYILNTGQKLLFLFLFVYLLFFVKTTVEEEIYLIFSFILVFYIILSLWYRVTTEKDFSLLSGYDQNNEPGSRNLLSLLKDITFILLIAFSIALHLKFYFLELYRVEQKSMSPTLFENQQVLVEKITFGILVPGFLKPTMIDVKDKKLKTWMNEFNVELKYEEYAQIRLPLVLRPLQRGDIIVFYGPEKNGKKLYIKRIIGKPGDRIQYSKKNGVFVDGKKIDEPYLSPVSFTRKSNVHHDGSFIPPSIRSKGENAENAYIHGLGNSIFQIPENMFFVLGDNRKESIDSRNWGFIPVEFIIGRLIFSFNHVQQ